MEHNLFGRSTCSCFSILLWSFRDYQVLWGLGFRVALAGSVCLDTFYSSGIRLILANGMKSFLVAAFLWIRDRMLGQPKGSPMVGIFLNSHLEKDDWLEEGSMNRGDERSEPGCHWSLGLLFNSNSTRGGGDDDDGYFYVLKDAGSSQQQQQLSDEQLTWRSSNDNDAENQSYYNHYSSPGNWLLGIAQDMNDVPDEIKPDPSVHESGVRQWIFGYYSPCLFQDYQGSYGEVEAAEDQS
ncbi:hypothetical protein Dimus_003020 [Dionaea muscipula]